MSDFEFPTNIKQIGSITGKVKIYMEDYVCSYLQKYGSSGEYVEKLAVLLGRRMVIDGALVLFISGAVQAKHTKHENDIETFSDETWEDIHTDIDAYFPDFEILGWVQSQPGYGVHLNANYAAYHYENFKEGHHVLFVIDPIEKSSAFYTLDDDTGGLVEAKGYFIYYAKNEAMQEYMVQNNVSKIRIQADEVHTSEDRAELLGMREDSPSHKPRRPAGESKRLINMLVSLSALLLLICFIMGMGLIQNEDRIAKLETSLTDFSDLYAQIKNGRSEQVFANEVSNESALIIDDGSEAAKASAAPSEAPLAEITPTPISTPTSTPTPTPTPLPTQAPTATSAPAEATQDPPISSTRTIPETYMVEAGDSLLYISNYFYGTTGMVDEIMALNNLDNPDKIVYGMTLKLPEAK